MRYNDPFILEDESRPIKDMGQGIQLFLGYDNRSDMPMRSLIFVRERWGKQWVHIVHEDKAYQFVEDDSLYSWGKEIVKALGLTGDRHNWTNMASALEQAIDDVVKMPPARIQSFVERTERLMRDAGIRSIQMNGRTVAD